MSSSIEAAGKSCDNADQLAKCPALWQLCDRLHIHRYFFFICKEVAIHAEYFRDNLFGTFLLVSKPNIASLFTLSFSSEGSPAAHRCIHSWHKIAAETRQIFGSANM
jgi:hypothetical protein